MNSHKSVQPIILFQNMIEAPQVQSILNSKYISEKDAKVIISNFLAEQKKYLEDAAAETTTNVVPSGDDDGDGDGDVDGDADATVGEENAYDMMDDDDNVVGFEEVQSRLGGILRSLSGIKKEQPVEYNITAASVAVSPVDDQAVDSITPLAAAATAAASASEASIADSVVSAESESNVPMNVDASTPQKKGDKSQRKAEKEAKKSAKKAEKEAKKSAKKAKKEAKKERKLKRKSSGGSSSSKKMKREK